MNEVVEAPSRRKRKLTELDRLRSHGFFGDSEAVELIAGLTWRLADFDFCNNGISEDEL